MTEPYGTRIRAVCDYLETVPGDKYDFGIPPSRTQWKNLDCGCVIGHGFLGKTIPHHTDGLWNYNAGIEWMLGPGINASKFGDLLYDGNHLAISRGEQAKQAAIAALRAYADKHYPLTPTHTGLPDVVRQIFQPKVAA